MANKIYLTITFILIFIFFTHPFEGTGDFYHHVNTGRFIIENKVLPDLDTFSHTAKNQPWVAHSWLSGLIFYILLSNFGEISISFLSAFVAVFTLLLLFLLLRTYSISKIASLITLAITSLGMVSRWPQRPEIFAYPITIAILLVDSKKEHFQKIVILLPLLILLWANLYGSAVLFGLGLIGLLMVKQLIKDKFKIPRNNRMFYLSCLTAFPISILNGYGFKTIFYFYLYIPKVSTYEGEWAGIIRIIDKMPLGQLVTAQYYIIIYFIFLSVLAILILFSYKILRKNLYFLILASSIFLPFFAFRIFPLSSILSSLLIAVSLDYLFKKRSLLPIVTSLALGIIAFYILIWINPPRYSSSLNIALEKMVEFIKTNKIYGNALNLGHFGGFITYKLYPDVLVFFDTRDELYINSEGLSDLYDTYNNNKSILPLLDKYNIDLVIADYLTDGMNYHDLFYSLDWSIVYLNDRYFVAVPAKVAEEKKLNKLTVLDPFSATAAKRGFEKEAKKYYENILNSNPNSISNRLYLASVLSALGEYDKVIKIASNIKIDKRSPVAPLVERDIYGILAESYLEKNDCQNSRLYLNKVNKPLGRVLIFKSQESSYTPKALAFYYLICEKDFNLARNTLDDYLANPNISPLERIKLERKFVELSQNKIE